MPLILDKNAVLEMYALAREKRWVLPTFNTENLTTTEAILSAVCDYGKEIGVDNLPIIVGITNTYKDRPQSVYYSHTRNWEIGLKLFLKDLDVLTSPESPFGKLNVMIHLDHIIWNEDLELLDWDMQQFSSIMYDASTLPFEENIKKTAQFVKKNRNAVLIEGACDEISKAETSGNEDDLTTPEMAETYLSGTGVDIIVPNLGTEHRAKASTLKYHGDLARQISAKTGPNLCLHGTSSVSQSELKNLFDDGICKVNLWTALERDSTYALFFKMAKNASKLIGPEKTKEMVGKGLLGIIADGESAPSLDYYTTTYRQDIIFHRMKEIINEYLSIWYR
ncbi:MAG: class II fructose-bisphosphate aldolase [Balneolaceae bacterium]|nr:class II fructose-bisphosphate aldolase [Balneolaceae bacterium]